MNKVRSFFLILVVGVCLWTTSCSRSSSVVVPYTSVDQVFSDPIFRQFERQSGIQIRAVFDTEETKSTGVLNRLIAEAQHPQADVFWSGDPVRPFLLMKKGLVEPYVSPNAANIPEGFKAQDGAWTGFAARARVFLVNQNRLNGREAPRSIRDLTDTRWRGEATLANPLFGTTTMHAAALFSAWGDEQAKTFFRQLRANHVRVASSNGEVKRLVVAGEVTFGLTDTDDANEALKENAPVEVIYPDQEGMGTLVMPTTVVLIRGGPNPEKGKRLIDFLLSTEVEQRMAESAAHMPLRAGIPTPPHVRSVSALRAMRLDFAEVAEAMERIQPWLREWAGLE